MTIQRWTVGLLATLAIVPVLAAPAGFGFTYQGRLQQGGTPVNGKCRVRAELWTHPTQTAGQYEIAFQEHANVNIVDGLFTVHLDFGDKFFNGDALWLQLSVGCPNDAPLTVLSPRQAVTPTPYALHAFNAPDGHSLDAEDGNPADALTVDDNGRVTVGPVSHKGQFSVGQSNASLPAIVTNGGKDYATTAGQNIDFGHWDGTTFTPRMFINGGGFVGFGTTSPLSPVHIAPVNEVIDNGGQPDGGDLRIGPSSGFADRVLFDADEIQAADNQGPSTLALNRLGGGVKIGQSGGGLALGSIAGVDFAKLDVHPNSGNYAVSVRDTGGTVRFYVHGNGKVSMGTSSSTYQLTVSGTAGKTGGGQWSVFSDRRLKKNIAPLVGALERLLKLRGVSYEYKKPAAINETAGEHIGFVGQEVEEVFPDWISETDDGHKVLSIKGATALTVEALRELRAEKDREIAELRAQLDEQRASQRDTMAALTARLAELEERLSADRDGSSAEPAEASASQ